MTANLLNAKRNIDCSAIVCTKYHFVNNNNNHKKRRATRFHLSLHFRWFPFKFVCISLCWVGVSFIHWKLLQRQSKWNFISTSSFPLDFKMKENEKQQQKWKQIFDTVPFMRIYFIYSAGKRAFFETFHSPFHLNNKFEFAQCFSTHDTLKNQQRFDAIE